MRIGDDDELLVNSPEGVMLGYWNDPESTAMAIDNEGRLHTGDQARVENRHIHIIGRIKDIIVMANGDKAPPVDMELAIALDSLFDQVMVIGEGCPYLGVIAVLNPHQWSKLASELKEDPADPASLEHEHVHAAVWKRITRRLHAFPGYAQVRRVALTLEPWTIENGLLTPPLKLHRGRSVAQFKRKICDSEQEQ